LSKEKVPFKDFKEYGLNTTSGIKDTIEAIIRQTGCHYQEMVF